MPLHPCQCEILEVQISGRVISRGTSFPWPAHSPDLSPLDYWLRNSLENSVFDEKPSTIEELKDVVEQAAASISSTAVGAAVANFSRRVFLCLDKNGCHSELEP